jgi:aryl-alcohol dehydrogenase-like predicted oxidoreductase
MSRAPGGAGDEAASVPLVRRLRYVSGMESRRFDRLQRSVSRLGMAVTGLYRRPDVTPPEVARAIGLALDLGVEVLDTATVLGASEELCGQTLRELGAWERVMLATRVPAAAPHAVNKDVLADDEEGQEGEVFADPLPRLWPLPHLEERLERSLRATKLPVIPLALLEGWRDSWLRSPAWPELAGAMVQMQRKGKVLRWGLALPFSSIAHAEKILDEPLIAAVAAPYCLWSAAAERLAAAAAERQVAFLAQLVMGQGGLSGEIVATAEFPPGDVRGEIFASERGRIELSRRIGELAAFTKSVPAAAQSSDEARQALEEVRRVQRHQRKEHGDEAADRLAPECQTLAELAVRFPLSDPNVASAVVGMSSRAHVRQNAEAAALGTLPEHALVALRGWMARYRS